MSQHVPFQGSTDCVLNIHPHMSIPFSQSQMTWIQGQVEGNENLLLRFMMLINDGPKVWMCKICGHHFTGNCQRAYHYLLGIPGSGIKSWKCSREQKAEITHVYEAHNFRI